MDDAFESELPPVVPGEPYHAEPADAPAPNRHRIRREPPVVIVPLVVPDTEPELLALLAEVERRLAAIRNPPRPRYECRRCGHVWEGRSRGNPPLRCARCHSVYWAKASRHPNARHPSDPPLASWQRKRKAATMKRVAKQLSRQIGEDMVVLSPPLSPTRLTLLPPPPRFDATPPAPAFGPPPRMDAPQPEGFQRPLTSNEVHDHLWHDAALEARSPRPDAEPPELDPDLARELERHEDHASDTEPPEAEEAT